MATIITSVDASERSDNLPRPYAPSWANVFASWLERLPGPTWTAYLGAMALATLLSLVEASRQGTLTEIGAFGAAYYGGLPFAVLWLMHSLDGTASRALRTLGPLLEMGDAETALLRYKLTVAPARPAALLAAIVFVYTPLGYAMDPVGSGVDGLTGQALFFRFAWESMVSAAFLVLVYHTIRQLRLIPRIHAGIGRIDVFDQSPLYAFSQVTSRTALGLILLLVPSLFLLPSNADVSYIVISAGWYVFTVAISASAFVLPLRGIHDRLAEEKRQLQTEIGRRLTTSLQESHLAVDARDGAAIEARNRAITTLIAQRDLVNKVPTWPWSTGALTGFLSAVLLPLALFLIQRFLGDVLGR